MHGSNAVAHGRRGRGGCADLGTGAGQCLGQAERQAGEGAAVLSERDDERRAFALLEEWGVSTFFNRTFGSLSDGERKRVQIARALMTDPELLLLDEPGAGLDLAGREGLVRRLSELAADPMAPSTVLVTHHLEEIPPGFTHALLLREGGVVAQGPITEVLTEDNLSNAFGLPLAVTSTAGRYTATARS